VFVFIFCLFVCLYVCVRACVCVWGGGISPRRTQGGKAVSVRF
jgi:hypothetical protein